MAVAASDATTLPAESAAAQRLVYTNAGADRYRYEPAQLTMTLALDAVRQQYPTADRVRLIPPSGWGFVGSTEQQPLGTAPLLSWTLAPSGQPMTCEQGITGEVYAGAERLGSWRQVVQIEIRGYSQFDPERHTLPFRNAASDFGAVEPRPDLFARTYRQGGALFANRFFDGLYRDIVFLSPATDERGSGGLCTGMARFALERSLQRSSASEARLLSGDWRASAMEAVQAWHGRQLTDRALLAAARQFFTASPSVAFWHFREGVLAQGRGDVAFDVGIARWDPSPAKWGAMLQTLVTQGHTIVPYAFRQVSDSRAEVQVYDPSYPDRADWPDNVVHFDLINDRYAYRGFGALDHDDATTVLAVPQQAFAGEGTAYLASLANMALHPQALAAEWRENAALRRGVALAGGMLAAAVVALRRRRA